MPDPGVRIATNDVLVANTKLRRLFDHHLAAARETSPDGIAAEIGRELKRLTRSAVHQADHLLLRYRDYRDALTALDWNPIRAEGVDEAIHQRLGALQQERAHFFSTREI